VSAATEADEFGKFVRRVVRAYSRRVGDRDIEALAGLHALQLDVDAALEEAVQKLRDADYSWADIGRQLGLTRQGAQQKFRRAVH
jgi:AraC-like DNA-binding protein